MKNWICRRHSSTIFIWFVLPCRRENNAYCVPFLTDSWDIIAKNLHGETETLELCWMPEHTRFFTLDMGRLCFL